MEIINSKTSNNDNKGNGTSSLQKMTVVIIVKRYMKGRQPLL